MAMKYVAAYLMNVLGGKDSPSAADVKRTLQAVGADVDAEVLDTLIKAMQGKTVHEVIAAGMEKLQKAAAPPPLSLQFWQLSLPTVVTPLSLTGRPVHLHISPSVLVESKDLCNG
ncbi:60s acidic ribosomal protein [Cyclospora cayetanensis]|uniref:60s acidic ribosomal protein n=1 Tax=Cyclospora cayetanensis TaxID=88456 RepID=A0A1D3D5I5_9EIME|nr:60s acidic ribosomal protein [Cyclospora cayetanensis]